jgi:hypothetical protein
VYRLCKFFWQHLLYLRLGISSSKPNPRANNLLGYYEMVFYKGTLRSFLKPGFIPGTVTRDVNEAACWADRISGKSKKGPSKHISHGKSCVIAIVYDEKKLKPAAEFQRPGVHEHKRENCWTSDAKIKAQINTPVEYEILTDEEIWDLLRYKSV